MPIPVPPRWFSTFHFLPLLLLVLDVKSETLSPQLSQIGNLSLSEVNIENFMIFSRIRYRYAKTMVFCEIRNNNELDEKEVTFAMEVPEDAFISNFTMEIDGKQYKSSIRGRQQANNEYHSARNSGQAAAIINEEKSMFTLSIILGANATVLFYLEYEEEIVKILNGRGHYQYAVSIAPQTRYQVKHFCVDVDIQEFKSFKIIPENICNEQGECINFDLTKEAILLPRPNNAVRIIWEPSSNGSGPELSKYGMHGKFKINYEFSGDESINDVLIRNGYFVHRFGPKQIPTIPLHIIFVLDISESMIGPRKDQMSKAMSKILGDLGDHDCFNIITFSSSTKHWQPLYSSEEDETFRIRAYDANFYFKEIAKSYINNLVFEGSTNIHDALMDALDVAKISAYFNKNRNPKPSPMIFFLTDGSPTSGVIDPLLILNKVEARNTIHVPIFSLAFGSAADFSLLQTLSSQNHGIARMIYDNAGAEIQLADFYDFVAMPIFNNLTFRYTSLSPFTKVSDVTYDPNSEHWLTSNNEITVAGKIDLTLNAEVNWWTHLRQDHGIQNVGLSTVVLARQGEDNLNFTARICICGRCPENPEVAYKRNNKTVDQLMHFGDDRILCTQDKDDDLFMERFWVHKTLRKLIREAIRRGNVTNIEKILEMSLQYSLVTPFTSLLIMTPHGKNTKNNGVTYNPPPVSELTIRDNMKKNGVPKSLLDIQKPKNPVNTPQLAFYSATLRQRSPSELEKPSTLVSYWKSLVSEQESAVKTKGSKNVTNIEIPLNLTAIKWMDTRRYNLTLVNRSNETYVFKIMQSGKSQSHYPKCRRENKARGKCTHLAHCIETDYLSDITYFVKSYFCPLKEGQEQFVGTCCKM